MKLDPRFRFLGPAGEDYYQQFRKCIDRGVNLDRLRDVLRREYDRTVDRIKGTNDAETLRKALRKLEDVETVVAASCPTKTVLEALRHADAELRTAIAAARRPPGRPSSLRHLVELGVPRQVGSLLLEVARYVAESHNRSLAYRRSRLEYRRWRLAQQTRVRLR